MRHTDYTTLKLRNHPKAQMSIRRYSDGSLVMRSYQTDVIVYNAASENLYCTGLYSATTRKHISYFLTAFFPMFDFQTIKEHCTGRSTALNVKHKERRQLDPVQALNLRNNTRWIDPNDLW